VLNRTGDCDQPLAIGDGAGAGRGLGAAWNGSHMTQASTAPCSKAARDRGRQKGYLDIV